MYPFAVYINIFAFVYLILILLMMTLIFAFSFFGWQPNLSLFLSCMEFGCWFLRLLLIPSVALYWLVQPMDVMSYMGPPILPWSMMSSTLSKTFFLANSLPFVTLSTCFFLLDVSFFFYMISACCLDDTHPCIRYCYVGY